MKKLRLTVSVLIFTMLLSITALAGWKQEGEDWRYYNNDGTIATNVFKRSGKTNFYLDENGNMAKSCEKLINGFLYTFDANGYSTRSKADESGQRVYYENDYALTQRQQYLNKNANPYNNNDVVQWINATYAVYTRQRSANIRVFGGILRAESMAAVEAGYSDAQIKNVLQSSMQASWGVTDRESADVVLNNLVNSATATGSAWDYSRAMSNLGHYAYLDYYTTEEALNKALEIAQNIQKTYHSWDEFYANYFVGYDAWAAENASSENREDIYNSLKGSAFNPFAIDWNLELKKTW